ncbi:hypothetical protein SLEP1_g22948 [Rubroshorea leprosula]|uniref:Uncharacterized protein n=1 Tax=Rubroshorea leprosula TaxID=152421 RepID=A0AAV5JAR3_9ROSI|nr:hypothetical protein SLEP1_g22948 [Rubroshorea leprosula]
MLNSKNWKKTRFRGNEIYRALQEVAIHREEGGRGGTMAMQAREDMAYQRTMAVIWRSQLEELEEHGISKNNGLSLPITSVLNSKNTCKDLHALVRHKSADGGSGNHTHASVHHPNLPPHFTSLLPAFGHFLLRCLPVRESLLDQNASATDRTWCRIFRI